MARNSEWPISPLQAAGQACDLLTAPPSPLTFDGRGFAGLPQRELDIAQLRHSLMASTMTAVQRDVVWRDLVARTRGHDCDGQLWTLIVVRLALPGLTKVAGALARRWHGEVVDLDAEVLAGFLLRLRTLDLAGPWVLGRLLNAATRAGRRACAVDDVAYTELMPMPDQRFAASTSTAGHPDAVLAQAVAAGVLDRTEAQLIGATRLEDIPLAAAAAALNVAPRTASTWRQTAEERLVHALAEGDLDHVRVVLATSTGVAPAAGRRAVRPGHRLQDGVLRMSRG